MKNRELFYESVNILQKAYYNGTLQHGNPCGCAVGNLVVSACGIKTSFTEDNRFNWNNKAPLWYERMMGVKQTLTIFEELGEKQINATGYSIEEIKKIEGAFEYPHPSGKHNVKADKDGFNGLCNVLEALMEIHEFNKEDLLPEKEQIFNKEKLELIEL
jgi:hypothetical protein